MPQPPSRRRRRACAAPRRSTSLMSRSRSGSWLPRAHLGLPTRWRTWPPPTLPKGRSPGRTLRPAIRRRAALRFPPAQRPQDARHRGLGQAAVRRPDENAIARPGDKIHVEADIGVVYIMVKSPVGVSDMPPVGELTLSCLVSAAGGLGQIAIPQRVDLIRRSPPIARQRSASTWPRSEIARSRTSSCAPTTMSLSARTSLRRRWR